MLLRLLQESQQGLQLQRFPLELRLLAGSCEVFQGDES